MEQEKILTSEGMQAYLKQQNIDFKLYEHEAAPTIEVLKSVTKYDKAPYVKNLFFADKKKNFYFVLAKHDTTVEKSFWKGLSLKAGDMRLAKEEYVMNILGCKQGCVNPFSIVNDSEKKVAKFIIDSHLVKEEYWSGHPMENTASVECKQSDVMALFQKIGRDTTVFDLDVAQEEAKPQQKQEKKPAPVKKEKAQAVEGETLLKVTTKKSEDLGDWYKQVLLKADLINWYSISGCFVLRPWAFAIWEKIQAHLDAQIKEDDVENCYFPMFVTEEALQKEKDHIEGFSPEVAWVTKSGQSTMDKPIAIRPTSETIMYPYFKQWIRGHRDLPLKVNQWSNVVRWEFKHPTPFIRTREFLWQEGHTAHETKEEADAQTLTALEFYRKTYEELLAVPVIKGVKTEAEKFPGGDFTTTVETIIPENGRAIQAATSHQLGQNFAKMFEIEFEDKNKEKKKVWQTSWGFTTRSIGVMILFHGDDIGLVLPPRVANIQVVIVPIIMKDKEKFVLQVQKAKEIAAQLKKAGIRVKVDDSANNSPGWKFSHWEVKGVPLRLELGPKDFDKQELRAVVRVNNEKKQISWDGVDKNVNEILEEAQNTMFKNAQAKLNSKIHKTRDWKGFMEILNQKNAVYTPWCNVEECEEVIKKQSGEDSKMEANENEDQLTGAAKSLCIPYDQPALEENEVCFKCGKKAEKWVLWGRSY